MKDCTCDKYQVFQSGCKCGAIEPYRHPYEAKQESSTGPGPNEEAFYHRAHEFHVGDAVVYSVYPHFADENGVVVDDNGIKKIMPHPELAYRLESE